MKLLQVVLSCLVLCSCVGPGYKYSLQENNDYFKPTKNNDSQYTQGLRIGASNGKHEYYLQQLLYTPDKPGKRSTESIIGERPYAGYLAVGYKNTESSLFEATTYGLEAGVVGPSAFGKQTQLGIHKALGQLYPLGWDNQLKDEPIVNLTVERRNRFVSSSTFDVTSLYGLNAGNLFDQVYTGTTFRYGYNLDSFPHSVIFPRLPSKASPVWAAYVFGEVLGRLVLRNLLLDGNTFRDSNSVESEPLVAEVRAGVVAEYKDYSAGWVYVRRSKEYETELSGADYGEVFLGVKW